MKLGIGPLGILAVCWLGCGVAFAYDGVALLSAIRDNVEENTPRLMYADWLDEQGGTANHARAEYIRLEVEPIPLNMRIAKVRRQRAEDLLRTYEREWLPRNFRELTGYSGRIWIRGFLDSCYVSTSHLAMPQVRRALDALPFLRALFVTPAGAATEARNRRLISSLNALNVLRRTSILSLENLHLEDANLRRLKLPAQRLRTLILSNNLLGDRAIQALARSSLAPHLDGLYLDNNPIGDDGIELLARPGAFPQLRVLDIVGTASGNLAPFAELGAVPRLQQLFVDHFWSEGEAAEDNMTLFFHSPLFRRLRSFSVLQPVWAGDAVEAVLTQATELEILGSNMELPKAVIRQLNKNRQRHLAEECSVLVQAS